MDYFNVIVLIIVIFVFVSDRKIRSVEEISGDNKNIYDEIDKIKENINILKVDMDKLNYNEFYELVKNNKREYLFIQNKLLNLSANDYDVLIANYIDEKKKIAAFNVTYKYKPKRKREFLKTIYINGINYLNIFNKYELTSYGVVILNKKDIDKIQNKKERICGKDILAYSTIVSKTKLNIYYNRIDKNVLKNTYLKKVKSSNLGIILKVLLLAISGSTIFASVIINILNFNLPALIVSASIYYCYSYLLRYMYSGLGMERYLATYIFPVYFVTYIIISISGLIKRE